MTLVAAAVTLGVVAVVAFAWGYWAGTRDARGAVKVEKEIRG